MRSLFSPLASLEEISLGTANKALREWGHKMGACNRPANYGWLACHGIYDRDDLIAVMVSAYLIRENVGGHKLLTRENTVELARLCACRPHVCRMALRMWRELIFPHLPYQVAISYQDATLHTGDVYRFDGWQMIGRSNSGFDKRSGRPGRKKKVWAWPPEELKKLEITRE